MKIFNHNESGRLTGNKTGYWVDNRELLAIIRYYLSKGNQTFVVHVESLHHKGGEIWEGAKLFGAGMEESKPETSTISFGFNNSRMVVSLCDIKKLTAIEENKDFFNQNFRARFGALPEGAETQLDQRFAKYYKS